MTLMWTQGQCSRWQINEASDCGLFGSGSFAVWNLLARLGAPEFGLISQAVLAAGFKSFGATMESMKQTGHPDMEFDYRNKHWRLEVEFVSPNRADFEVKDEDIEATKPVSELDIGYFAILDCNYPVNWKMVDTKKLMLEGLGFHSLRKLESLCDNELSATCTNWSAKFFIEHELEIVAKRFPGICREYVFPE